MKSCGPAVLLGSLFVLCLTALAAPLGTVFTYQGRLTDSGQGANGSFDLTFTLYAADTGGTALAGPLTNTAAVSNGLFTTTLDFGSVFDGNARWLEISVRTNGGGAFATLAPRQALTATAYAQYAPSAGTAASVSGTVPTAQLTGTVPLAQLPPVVLTNNATGIMLTGTFSGNGAGVTNVDLTKLNSWGGISATVGSRFILSSSPSVGIGPRSVAAADANGDGRVDLISANSSTNTLSVLTNNGSGGFALSVSPTVGAGPYSVAAADVNGDGWADLISANISSNTLTVLTNNRSGGFVVSASPSVGAGPDSVVAVDVNGDGRTDLVSANGGGNTLTVLTNNGSGGFALSSSPGVGNNPANVVAADVNNDGRPDLISVSPTDWTLSVLTNNGTGGFAVMTTPSDLGMPIFVAAADVNRDGWVDLIRANSDLGCFDVCINLGNGTFAGAAWIYGVGGPVSVATVDVNGDGWVDLIGANGYLNTLSVLTNNGSGGFDTSALPNGGTHLTSVAAADVNGDGRADLISANVNANTLGVFLNTPQFGFDGTFTGNGASLSNLNAGRLSSGTLADGRLSTNVALLNSVQIFSGFNTFSGIARLTNAANVLAGTFTGNGGGLTNVNADLLDGVHATAFASNTHAHAATDITSGSLSLARLPGAVLTNGAAAVTLSGTFTGNGSGLTNLNLANDSITAAKLASDAASLAKVSGGALSNSGGNIVASGTIASAQASEMQISPLHAMIVDAGLTVTPLADHYGALVVSAAGAGTYRLIVPLDIPLMLYGRKPTSWSVTTHYSNASVNNYITRTRVYNSHLAEGGMYVEDTTDRTSSANTSFAVTGPNYVNEEWRGKTIEYQVTLAAGGSLRIGGIIVNYMY